MQIYVVKEGDSLWSISNRFGVSQQEIIRANGLITTQYLVIGQAIIIPSVQKRYTVKPGDSIWSISRQFNVSQSAIIAANNLTNPNAINAGDVLIIPAEGKRFGFIETNGYIEPSTATREAAIVNEVGRYLTYITPFSYQVRADGSLITIQDTTILSTARNYRIAPLMAITNFQGGTFSTELGHAILSNPTSVNNLINNVISTMRAKGYYGLNVDFERILPEDRELYNNFLRKIAPALHNQGYILTTALAPKTSAAQTGPWYTAHDYPVHGQVADFVVLMTYEWGWSGGPPLPVAPINQVKKVLDYAVSVIPRKKIMMGMPLYGYNWTLPYQPGARFAPRVSPEEAITIAANNGARIEYDWTAQSPFFNYTANGVRHIVWFEDARSVQAKYVLLSDYGLRGASYWVLGEPFRQNWTVLNEMFNIVKVIR